MSLKREFIVKQREAHVQGAALMLKRLGRSGGGKVGKAHLVQDAIDAYPMPTVQEPRILKVENKNPASRHLYGCSEYKVVDGQLWYRYPGSRCSTEWKLAANETIGTLHAKLDLFANPTEEKEIG